jgi:hypothetical protein
MAAARALSARGELDLTQLESDPSPRVRAYVALLLALRGSNEDVRDDPRIAAILQKESSETPEARMGLLAAIADAAPSRRLLPLLLTLTELPWKAEGTELLARAAARQRDPRLIRPLIDLLSAREGREAVREALVQFGEPALDAVWAVLCDPAQPRNLRIHMPKTLARFGGKRVAERLLANIETDGDGLVRYKSLCALGALVSDHRFEVDRIRAERLAQANVVEYFKLLGRRIALQTAGLQPSRPTPAGRLLVGLLDDKRRQSLDRCFRLLKIAHPREDIRGVQAACLSDDPYAKANAAEFLDTRLGRRDEQRLRHFLQIVADDLDEGEQIARAALLLPANAPQTQEESLADLVGDPDVMVATLAGIRALEVGGESLRARVASIRRKRPEVDVGAAGLSPGLQDAKATVDA